jgi:ABC-type proline/glycine betaine transport system permease subunit
MWVPRTVVVGWAPYRYGHWVWISPWGWTWVDDAVSIPDPVLLQALRALVEHAHVLVEPAGAAALAAAWIHRADLRGKRVVLVLTGANVTMPLLGQALSALALAIVLVPYFTSFLIRVMSWQILLARGGPLEKLANTLHIYGGHVDLLDTKTAVFIGLVYVYLPIAVVPLYVVLERIPQALVESGRDLGATRWQVFLYVILPISRPGIATVLLVGIGVRWLAAAGVWRAIRSLDSPDTASWRLLAWGVVSGIAIPFVLTTNPYVDTLQFYLTGLYLMWIFTAVALVAWARARPVAGAIAIAVAVALSLPSSLHYLDRKLTDRDREPRVGLNRSEVAVAEYLRSTDPERTVILHDRPLTPSLTAIVAARRIVLGWDVRYSAVGGEGRLREVNRFYSSVDGDPAAAAEILRRYQITHVIVRSPDDRVHPDILAGLKLVLKFPDVALYEVPAGL